MTPNESCDAMRAAIAPYLDGELDAAERAVLERHAAGCAECRAAIAEARALSGLFRTELARAQAPAGLAAAIGARLAGEGRREGARTWWSWRTPALAAAAIALLVLGGVFARWALPLAPGDLAGRDAIAAHVRGLVSERLIDVASSDRHTVKPWFDGRVTFAPPVEDLTAEGFRLAGGRVDFIGGRRVAALVYRHRQHVLTLFVVAGDAPAGPADADGYSVVHWRQAGMSFFAVSDIERADLERFASLLRARLSAR